MPDGEFTVETVNLVKEYRTGEVTLRAVDEACFGVRPGEFVAIIGPSGSGKSSLLNLLGGLTRPTSGSVLIEETDLAKLSDDALARFRRRRMGFVFQFFNLIPTLTAWENVAVPRMLDGESMAAVRPRALELLDAVGLGHRARHKPGEMSGGEMQRVAIARALVAAPPLVLADEPSGNLDQHNGRQVLELLRDVSGNSGSTLILVTHDPKAAAMADRVVRVVDGQVSPVDSRDLIDLG